MVKWATLDNYRLDDIDLFCAEDHLFQHPRFGSEVFSPLRRIDVSLAYRFVMDDDNCDVHRVREGYRGVSASGELSSGRCRAAR